MQWKLKCILHCSPHQKGWTITLIGVILYLHKYIEVGASVIQGLTAQKGLKTMANAKQCLGYTILMLSNAKTVQCYG